MLNAFTEEEIKDLFENFFCRDKDIESFLRFKAIEFEKAKKARIYLFLILIKDVWLAFFSISNQVLNIPVEIDGDEIMSVRKRKKLDGYTGKSNGKILQDFPVFLIGQLARNEKYSKELLPGKKILEAAIDTIIKSSKIDWRPSCRS